MESRKFAIIEGRNEVPPAVFAPLRGLTPEGLVPMPPHDTADDCIRVPLHSKKYPNLFALIDPEDAELVGQYKWHPYCVGRLMTPYAHGRLPRNRKFVPLHRLVLGLSPGDPAVDHINGNGLDNRKKNLSLCTDSQNQANRNQLNPNASSRFRGVTWNRSCGKWQAGIKVKGRSYHLGLFDHEEDAADAYDRAAVQHFGEFANPNRKGNAA